MKFLLVFVVAIIIVNFGYASRSPAYCIKKVLRPRDLYVNGVKTTKYDTKILRVCCEGYTQYRRRCVPLCEELCINSVCTAPNTCSCKKGYTKLNDHRCAPSCDNCKYGFCVAPDVCVCYKGYVKDNSTGVCSPVCSQPCTNGYCSDPDFCTCHEGYKISPQNLYTCERNDTLDSTTLETTQDITTTFVPDITMRAEFNESSSMLLHEVSTKTYVANIQTESSSLYYEPSTTASTSLKSTSSPSETITTTTGIFLVPKRRSKALQSLEMFVHPPISYNSLKETTQHVPDTKDPLEPISTTPSSDWTSRTTDRSTIDGKPTSRRIIDNGSRITNRETAGGETTEDDSSQGEISETKPTDRFATLLPSEALERKAKKTSTSILKKATSHGFNQETTRLIPKVNTRKPPDLTSKFDQFRDFLSTTTTPEFESQTENLYENNKILKPNQNEILVKEVQSSKILSKNVLLTVYSLLALLAIIGMYVLLWFICSCKRLHEKEYHIARLGMEKKKGVVKYSAERNDVITAW